MRNRLSVFCFLFSVSCFLFPCIADASPRVVVIVCTGLTLEDLRDSTNPALAGWTEQAAIAMMNQAAKASRDVSPAALFGLSSTLHTAEIAISRQNPDGAPLPIDSPLADYQAFLNRPDTDLVVIRLRDLERLAANGNLASATHAAALRRLNLLISLLMETPPERPTDWLLFAPPITTLNAKPERLFPFAASGPDFPPGLLISATTRTPGLVSNRDVAPTLALLLHLPIKNANEGRPLIVRADGTDGAERTAKLARIAYLAELNNRALWPVTAGIFALCASLILAGFGVRKRKPEAARYFAPVFVFALNAGAAAMLAPLLVPPTLLEYGLRFAAWMLGLTVACHAVARLVRLPPPLAAALFALALVAGDTLTGQRLLKDALISDYALAGIRYYGIGNEYLGMALGMTLTGSFAWLDARRVSFPPNAEARSLRGGILLCWVALLLLFGWPGLGANAGSLVACGAGFSVGAALLLGRPANWKTGAIGAFCGLLLAFTFSLLDARFSQGQASHLGAVLQETQNGRGAGYPAAIVLRKIAMNFRLLLSPGFLLAAGGVAVTAYFSQKVFGAEWRDLLARHLWLAQSRKALLAAGIASLLFKDSGVVTGLFLAGSAWLIFAWFLFTAEPVTIRAGGNLRA